MLVLPVLPSILVADFMQLGRVKACKGYYLDQEAVHSFFNHRSRARCHASFGPDCMAVCVRSSEEPFF